MKKLVLIVLLLVLASGQLLGVSMARFSVVCPVCGEKNEFYMLTSMGGYVYNYPPKYYRLPWQFGYPQILWVCKHCHYAAWPWDFNQLDKEELSRVREALKSIRFVNFNDYAQVPLHLRMALAEQCAKAAGKDDVFWSTFYRAQAYHLGRVGRSAEARHARVQARDLLIALSQDPAHAAEKKNILFALATVQHFLIDDAAALNTLDQAKQERLVDAPTNKDVNHDIDEYMQWIKTNAIPPDEHNGVPYPLVHDLFFDEKGNYISK